MKDIYEDSKDKEDEFLYITYSDQETFVKWYIIAW